MVGATCSLASHLMVSFNTTLPKVQKLAQCSTVLRLMIFQLELSMENVGKDTIRTKT